jgi:hypothetical protein
MKKNCVYQALSLSLSPPLEERAKEERSGGVGPWSGPTTRGLPYLADMYLTTSAYPPSQTCALLPPAGGNKAHIGLVWCNAAIRRTHHHQASVNKICVELVWCNAAFCCVLLLCMPCPTTWIAIFSCPYPVPLADQPPSIAFHLSYIIRPHSPNGPP